LIRQAFGRIPQLQNFAPGHIALAEMPTSLEEPVETGSGNSTETTGLRTSSRLKGIEVNLPDLPPLFVYGAILVGFVVTNLLVAHLLGPKKKTPVKDMPYESGMDPVGDARKPFDIKFYLTAILFLVFDIELLFLYPWAVSLLAPDGVPEAFRPAVLAVLMVLLITLALAYWVAYRKGVFDWRRK